MDEWLDNFWGSPKSYASVSESMSYYSSHSLMSAESVSWHSHPSDSYSQSTPMSRPVSFSWGSQSGCNKFCWYHVRYTWFCDAQVGQTTIFASPNCSETNDSDYPEGVWTPNNLATFGNQCVWDTTVKGHCCDGSPCDSVPDPSSIPQPPAPGNCCQNEDHSHSSHSHSASHPSDSYSHAQSLPNPTSVGWGSASHPSDSYSQPQTPSSPISVSWSQPQSASNNYDGQCYSRWAAYYNCNTHTFDIITQLPGLECHGLQLAIPPNTDWQYQGTVTFNNGVTKCKWTKIQKISGHYCHTPGDGSQGDCVPYNDPNTPQPPTLESCQCPDSPSNSFSHPSTSYYPAMRMGAVEEIRWGASFGGEVSQAAAIAGAAALEAIAAEALEAEDCPSVISATVMGFGNAGGDGVAFALKQSGDVWDSELMALRSKNRLRITCRRVGDAWLTVARLYSPRGVEVASMTCGNSHADSDCPPSGTLKAVSLVKRGKAVSPSSAYIVLN